MSGINHSYSCCSCKEGKQYCSEGAIYGLLLLTLTIFSLILIYLPQLQLLVLGSPQPLTFSYLRDFQT
jgi:hypothetical protein